MKTKLSKKVLSCVLALTMVITTLSCFTFTAFATDDDVATLQAAMTTYETTMSSLTDIKTNMGAAYNAYVAAQKAYDAYYYGGVSSTDLSAAATTLTNATSAMGNFTAKTGTAVPTVSGGAVSSEAYANVVYATNGTDFAGDFEITNGSVMKYGCHFKTYYPETVLLYDGTTTPKFPAILGLVDSSKRYDVYASYYFPTTTNLALNDFWYGYSDGFGWSTTTSSTVGYSTSSGVGSGSMTVSNTGTARSFKNTLSYTGTPSSTSETISGTSWQGMIDHNSQTGTTSISTPIYVINYKTLADAISTAKTTYLATLKLVSSYKEGGMSTLMSAFDAATSLDPNTFDYSTVSTGVSNCAAAIDSAVSGLSSVTSTIDSSSYASLRSAMTSSIMSLYATNNADGVYSEETFATFKTAYEAAQSIMASVVASGYTATSSSISTAVSNLSTAFSGLEYAQADLADTTAFNIAYNYGLSLTEDYYTSTTWTSLQSALSSTLANVYSNGVGSVPNYGTDEQSSVDAQTQIIWSTIAGLRLDSTTLDSDIAEADALNDSDYSNYSVLAAALTVAQTYSDNMKTTVFPATASNYADVEYTLYSNYVTAINDLATAVGSLQKSFTTMTDGEIISQTISSTEEVNTADSDGTNCNVRFFMKDAVRETVLFKTNAAKSTYTVPFDMTVTNGWYYMTWRAGARITGLGFGSTTSTTATTSASSTTGSSCSVALNWYDNTANDSKACAVAGSLSYHNALMQGECDGSDASANYIDAVADTENQKIYGNAAITVPARTSSTTTSRVYSVTTPTLYQSLYIDDSHGGLYSGANTTSNVTLTVVDISDFLSYISTCDSFVKEKGGNANGFYTTSTWNAFTSAITAAKNSMEYKSMTASEIGTEIDTRLSNLKSTYGALVEAVNKDNLTNAMTSSVVSTYNAGNNNYEWSTSTWATFKSAYETALTHANADYSNVARYSSGTTNSTTQSNVESAATALTSAFNALVPGLADFTALDNAVNTLANSAQSGSYTTASVEAAAEIISGLTYYNIADRSSVNADHQSDVDAELETVNGISLTQISTECLTNAISQAENLAVDKDAYDTENITDALEQIQSSITSQTTLVSGVVLTTVNYDSQSALDADVASILNTLEVKTYTVSVPDGVTCSQTGEISYGTEVTVSTDDESNVAWSMGFTSPTASLSSQYQSTGNSYTFVIKGNTSITTGAAGEETYRVRYVNAINGKTYDVSYVTSGEITLADCADCAFYNFDGYNIGGVIYSAGDTVTIDKNTLITAIYTAQTTEGFDIYVNPLTGRRALLSDTYNYNDLITLTTAGVYAWVAYDEDTDTYRLFSYGETLQFYVSETLDFTPYDSLESLTTDFFYDTEDPDYAPELALLNTNTVRDTGCDVSTRFDGPVTSSLASNGVATFVGQFVLGADKTLVECGYLIQTTPSDTNLVLSNAGKDTIIRCKSTKQTIANQFVINFGGMAENDSVRYCTYLTYKDSSGTMNTIYSSTSNTTLVSQ